MIDWGQLHPMWSFLLFLPTRTTSQMLKEGTRVIFLCCTLSEYLCCVVKQQQQSIGQVVFYLCGMSRDLALTVSALPQLFSHRYVSLTPDIEWENQKIMQPHKSGHFSAAAGFFHFKGRLWVSSTVSVLSALNRWRESDSNYLPPWSGLACTMSCFASSALIS